MTAESVEIPDQVLAALQRLSPEQQQVLSTVELGQVS